jgi:hypothetical protein
MSVYKDGLVLVEATENKSRSKSFQVWYTNRRVKETREKRTLWINTMT